MYGNQQFQFPISTLTLKRIILDIIKENDINYFQMMADLTAF